MKRFYVSRSFEKVLDSKDYFKMLAREYIEYLENYKPEDNCYDLDPMDYTTWENQNVDYDYNDMITIDLEVGQHLTLMELNDEVYGSLIGLFRSEFNLFEYGDSSSSFIGFNKDKKEGSCTYDIFDSKIKIDYELIEYVEDEDIESVIEIKNISLI